VNEANKVDLSGPPQTMLATLYFKALDADAAQPILGDKFAKELVTRLDIDWRKAGVTEKNAPSATFACAARTAQFDNYARQFLAEHERAVVLHLGCGLDSRAFRLEPGPGVEWYDVDYPDVIALREKLYPSRDHYHLVAASITDPAWLVEIPADRPLLLLVEGVTMYLTEEDGMALLRRVVEHFPSGELHFDVFNWLGIRSQKDNAVVRQSGSTLHWAVDDPDDIRQQVPGVRLLATEPVPQASPVTRVPLAYRRYGRWKSLPHAVKTMHQFHRFAF